MSDPIINQAAQQAAEQASQQGAQQPQPGEVDAQDQAQFEEALNKTTEQQPVEQADPSQVDPAQNQQPGEVEPVEPPSLGDAILDGVEKMKSNHDARVDAIEQQLAEADGEMSVQDCLKLQFEVMQMSIEQEVTGKIADKSSQGVQTLFKNQ